MSRIRKAVILAGGLGTRLLPLSRAIPKEMLPLGPKPILHYIVDELRGGGIEDVIIVSRKGKTAIAEYFDGEADVRVVEKDKALGPGHSLLVVQEYLGEDHFLVAYGDSPIAGETLPVFIRKLLDTHLSLLADVVVAVQKVPHSETHLRGIVQTASPIDEARPAPVTGFVEKPIPSESPGIWGVAGRVVFGPAIYDALNITATQASGEILLADTLKQMISEGRRVYALPLSEGLRRFDTGSLEGYFEAFRVFSKTNHRKR
jgi:UTP--glucose-1-phosphate uridylyltransferase